MSENSYVATLLGTKINGLSTRDHVVKLQRFTNKNLDTYYVIIT